MIKRGLGCLILVLVPALLGAYVGMLRADKKISGIDNPWNSLPLPDQAQPVGFIQGYGSIAYASSADGRLFSLELEGYRDLTWREVDHIAPKVELDARIAAGECTTMPVGPHPRWNVEPPSMAFAQLDCWHYVNAEHTFSLILVMLRDGDIQYWIRDSPGLGALGLYLFDMGSGVIGGALIGLALFGLLILIRRRGTQERRRYVAGEVREAVARPLDADTPAHWLERLEDQ